MKKQQNDEDELNYCWRCGNELFDDDLYCRYCGLKRGERPEPEKEYDPDSDEISIVYGPPMVSEYECKNCKALFTDKSLGSATVNFCPFCGVDNSSIDLINQTMDDWISSEDDDDDNIIDLLKEE